MGTPYRLRLGVIPLPAVVATRWWVYVCEGLADAIAAILLAGLLVNELALVPELLAALPLLLLIAVTTSSIGLLVGAISLTQRVDTLLTNIACSVMVFCGVVAPISALGDVGEFLVCLIPLTNGLLAIRAFVDNEPWLTDAALELAVGTAWTAIAIAVLQLPAHRARARGSDELL